MPPPERAPHTCKTPDVARGAERADSVLAAWGVQAITAAVLAGLSDIIAQKLAAKAPVNWRRTAAMAAFGGIWSGPSNHFWQARRGYLGLGDAGLRTLSQDPGRAYFDCTAATCAGVCGARVPRPLGPEPPDTEGACLCCCYLALLGFLCISTALCCLCADLCQASLKQMCGV